MLWNIIIIINIIYHSYMIAIANGEQGNIGQHLIIHML